VVSTKRVLNRLKRDDNKYEPKSPIGTGMFLPNESAKTKYKEIVDLKVTGDLEVAGELLGSRQIITLGTTTRITNTTEGAKYLKSSGNVVGTSTAGLNMVRDGKAIGMSLLFFVSDFLTTPGGSADLALSFRVNNVATDLVVTKTGFGLGVNKASVQLTRANGVAFEAGDVITCTARQTATLAQFTITKVTAVLEIQSDT